MRAGLIAGACLMLAAGGCGPAAAPAEEQGDASQPAPATVESDAEHEELDPFVVMIGAERWTVILDRALAGAREAPEPASPEADSDILRADAALKRGAGMVITLRNSVCAKGLVTGEACTLPDWPGWTRQAPTAATPLDELERRSAWLSEVMSPFTEAGCAAGRQATGDELFCSVE